MTKFPDNWKQKTHPSGITERFIQRDQWVKDILKLMLIVIIVSAVIIISGVFIGFFTFIETIPIYIFVIFTFLAWWGANHGGWRWARFFPTMMCLAMGIYSSYYNGFASFGIFYVLAILLAGLLIDLAWQRIVLVLSVLNMTYFSVIFRGETILANLDAVITFVASVVGVAILQWYYDTRFRLALSDRIEVNQALSEEIDRRHKAETDTENKQIQLKRLADNITDLITEISPEGIIHYASPSYQTILGYIPDLLVGTDAFALVHPEDLPIAYSAVKRSSIQKTPGHELLRCRHVDGHYIFIEISGSPILDANGELEGFVLSSRDVTRQKLAEVAAQEIENKYINIIESIPMGIHMYTLQEDGDLILTGCNPAADRLLGIDHSELMGKSIEQAFPELVYTDVPDKYKEVARTGIEWYHDATNYQDEQFSGSYEVTAFQNSPGKVVVMFSDSTERIKIAEDLRISEEKFSKAFLTSPDSININRLSDGMYLDINQGFTKLTGYTRADVIGKTSLELNIWANPDDRERLVAGLKEFGVVENLQATFRGKDGHIITGLMSATIMEINNQKWLLNITRDISDRIKNEEDLQKAHQMLEEAYDATLQGWVFALDLREHETADHSRRVVELTIRMAEQMGIDVNSLEYIKRGALLHDIGKMGVPDHILLKPGPLSDEEWVRMRSHPQNAYDLLNQISYLRSSLDIPFCHHERWDGKGYPRGIAGTEIPLSARIFAVIDVYDALLSDRPYRQAWQQEDVIRYLIENKGIQFDPEIVDAFLPLVYSSSEQYSLDFPE